jgi:hypothetical protein
LPQFSVLIILTPIAWALTTFYILNRMSSTYFLTDLIVTDIGVTYIWYFDTYNVGYEKKELFWASCTVHCGLIYVNAVGFQSSEDKQRQVKSDNTLILTVFSFLVPSSYTRKNKYTYDNDTGIS